MFASVRVRARDSRPSNLILHSTWLVAKLARATYIRLLLVSEGVIANVVDALRAYLLLLLSEKILAASSDLWLCSASERGVTAPRGTCVFVGGGVVDAILNGVERRPLLHILLTFCLMFACSYQA